MIGAQNRRLRSAFRAILLAASGSAAIQSCAACSSTEPARDDAVLARDGATAEGDDAVAPGTTDATSDAFDAASCKATYYMDATFTDADEDAQVCQIDLPCGLPTGLRLDGCHVYNAADDAALPCALREGRGCTADAGNPELDGGIVMDCLCDLFAGGGRRPEGFRTRRIRAATTVGSYFATLARLEAASVPAFERLARELEAFGAPLALVRAAERARRDEVRHAKMMDRLARRFGAPAASAAPRAPRRTRSLRDVARENAVEGCVRETYGALVAHWQAQHAADARVREVLARIAADETVHASLAWAVATWAEPRLDPQDRARVRAARRRAVRALRRQIAEPPARDVATVAGMPSPQAARRLLDGLEASAFA